MSLLPMRLDVVTNRPAPLKVTSSGTLTEWRVGALLLARSVTQRRGQLFLDIGSPRYSARVASGDGEGPTEGEQLQVCAYCEPARCWRWKPSRAPKPDTDDGNVTADALRRYLPRQASAAPLSSNLSFIARDMADAVPLPKSVIQAAASLWQAMP